MVSTVDFSMRLWSIHPKYLDTQGLLALWREALLAQKVLADQTKGYRHHPQLDRFKLQKKPLTAIGGYLSFVLKEGQKRGFSFRGEKINFPGGKNQKIGVSGGQLKFEFSHLMRKLKKRSPRDYLLHRTESKVRPHPLFKRTAGARLERWEKSGAVGKKPYSPPKVKA